MLTRLIGRLDLRTISPFKAAGSIPAPENEATVRRAAGSQLDSFLLSLLFKKNWFMFLY